MKKKITTVNFNKFQYLVEILFSQSKIKKIFLTIMICVANLSCSVSHSQDADEDIYDYCIRYYSNLPESVKVNEKYGFVSFNSGEEITPFKYDGIGEFDNGLARVRLNDKWGFVDKTGKEVTPIKYEVTPN
jgi:hypothetical protein